MKIELTSLIGENSNALFCGNGPVLVGHKGVIQVEMLAHLRNESHFLVDTLEAKRRDGRFIVCQVLHFSNLFKFRFMVDRCH